MSEIKVNSIKGVGASTAAITVNNSDGTCTANLTNRTNKNLVINGAMEVAQRGTSSTSSGINTVDRFGVFFSGTDEAPTQSQVDVSSGTTPYTLGFRKSLKVTNGNQTGGAGSSDYVYLAYKIEAQDLANSGWNYTSASSFITLSFWVKSSVAQNFYGYLKSQDGTRQNYPFETGSLSADTWTKVTKTIAGDSNLEIDNNNEAGLEIVIAAFWGTDKTGTVTLNQWAAYNTNIRMPDNTSTWYTTNDATLEITGVQLEVGSVATDFEHRSFGQELALCQRYYYQVTKVGSTSDVTNKPVALGIYYTGSDFRCLIEFPQEMRAQPTFSSNDTSNSFYIHTNNQADFIDKLDGYNWTSKRAALRNTANVSGSAGDAGFLNQETGDSNLNFSAEL